MTHLVFVYGTLKRGKPNHHYLKDAKFVTKAVTKTDFYMMESGFPVIVGFGYHKVSGELYEVNDQTLQELDILENEGVMYERCNIKVVDEDGGIEIAYAYIGNPDVWDNVYWTESEINEEGYYEYE